MIDDDPSRPCWRCQAARGCEHRTPLALDRLDVPAPRGPGGDHGGGRRPVKRGGARRRK